MSNIDLKTLISNVNDELSKVSRWLKVNKLSLNITETNFIIFHSWQRSITSNIHLRIDGMLIAKVLVTKLLGVLLNENLTWTDHVKVLLNKTCTNFGIIMNTNLHSTVCAYAKCDLLCFWHNEEMELGLGAQLHSCHSGAIA